MLHQWNIGHSKLSWDIRQEEGVLKVFSKIWNEKPENLLTSFDGMSIHLPPEVTNKGYFRGNEWFHTESI